MGTSELVDIEIRLAYQEDMINELNVVISKQDRIIIQLQAQVGSLAKKMDDYAFSTEGKGGADSAERPPHY